MRRLVKVTSSFLLSGAVVVALSTVVLAGGQHPTLAGGPSLAPTIQQQTAGWSSAQLRAYEAKLAYVNSHWVTPRAPSGSGPQVVCCGGGGSVYTLSEINVQEGGNDSWCGPATIQDMYSVWGISVSQAQAAADMGTNSSGAYRGPMQTEANRYQGNNNYVWQDLGPGGSGTAGAADLWNYTTADVSANVAPAYNGETYSTYHGWPLAPYQGLDYKHYFPASGYNTANDTIAVNDSHCDATYWYGYYALWEFTDNFTTGWGGNGGFVPNQILW
ncbi:MAG: C39 family peptidase [Candidatus Dormibacteria bacterium]